MVTTRIRLGSVIMDAVIDESPQITADITQKPVEEGQDVNDHMKINPPTIRLSGSMVNNASGKLEALKKYQRDAELLTYVGRNAYSNMVIKSLSTTHPVTNAEGFDYDIIIQQVKLARPETFEVKVRPPQDEVQTTNADKKTATKVRVKKNQGRVQPKTNYPATQARKGTGGKVQGNNQIKNSLMASFNRATGKPAERVGPTRAKAARNIANSGLPQIGGVR